MKKIQSTISIHRNIDDVFATVADYDSHAEWRTGLLSAALTSDDPVQAGSTYQYNIKIMGREIETTGEIKAYQPPTYYAWKATSGPFPLSGNTKCESTPDGGTKLTETIEVDPGGFFKLAESLLVKQQQEQMDKDLQKLKILLEN